MGDYWDRTEPAEFEVDIRSSTIYYPVESDLAAKLNSAAGRHGVSAETLLNLWLQEKMAEETTTQ